jgi:hypothetical protein
MSRTKGAHGKHNKVKPVKEKKKRGRPSKQHQHQQQKQIVNVNVNGGGGGGGGGNKTIPVPFQLPSTIYDPSLIAPHYGINDRQPVNPLTDAATDLMTPFIQSLISNQAQKVDKIPIKDAVKPINPVVPQPIPQSIQVPQVQSHPIPPEIIMDKLPIQSKKTQKKIIQKEIKPEMPPEPTPLHNKYKFLNDASSLKITQKKTKKNDTEGLGARIPIENIGALAGNIGAAALSGGATVAGEALITGGVAGLMGAGEAILGATIGSGVATGISTALGNSTAGHLISGVAGGVIGRTAGRRVANRLRNRDNQNQELQPLLSSNTGTRLGGRQGRNRIIEPQSQVLHDPQTGEISTWQIPPEQSQPSILNRTVQSLRNRAQNISDGIQNIRQQITGRITNTGRGRYSRVSTNEPIEQHEPMSASAPMSASEPPIINVTDEIMPLLNRSATRIQRLIEQ